MALPQEMGGTVSILGVFLSNVCPVCERPKRENTAFCTRCYLSLPQPKRSALWKKFGNGFEAAFDDSFYWRMSQPAQKQKTLFPR